MVKLNKYIPFYTGFLCLLLLIPVLSIPLVDPSVREWWERRKLEPLPEASEIWRNPKVAFSQFDDYLADHLGGAFPIIRARREFYHSVLGVTGDDYVVRNPQGALFLTAPFYQKTRQTPFTWWKYLCVDLQDPRYHTNYLDRLESSQKVLGRLGAKVVFTSVPTKAVLLSDKLPNSTPQKIVEHCQRVEVANNHITVLREANPDLNLFYPIREFKDRMADPYFFPNTNYHWSGESNWVFTEAFAEEYGLVLPRSWPAGPCLRKDVSWDIGRLMAIANEVTGCDRDEAVLGLISDHRFEYPLDAGAPVKSVRVSKVTNPYAENELTAVMFSNSFGPQVRNKFAAQFKTLYHLNGNQINAEKMQLLLKNSDILNADYAVVIIADFHYPRFLKNLE